MGMACETTYTQVKMAPPSIHRKGTTKEVPSIPRMVVPSVVATVSVLGCLLQVAPLKSALRSAFEMIGLAASSPLLMFCMCNMIVFLLLIVGTNSDLTIPTQNAYSCRSSSMDCEVAPVEDAAVALEEEEEEDEEEESDDEFNKKIEDFIAKIKREREREERC